MDQKTKKYLLRQHELECQAAMRRWCEAGCQGKFLKPPKPEELRGITCGARKKNGELCRNTRLGPGGRCPYHGGFSTGPRSEEGKQRCVEALRRSVEAKRAARQAELEEESWW